MMRVLTKTVSYRVGFHTNYLEKHIAGFKPDSVDSCVKIFELINAKKEYLPQTQLLETFVNRLEYFLFGKNITISQHSLYVYQQLKKLGILSGSFKYSLLDKIEAQLVQSLDRGGNIKGNQLESLLWFVYREYPFLRETRFQEIASRHSLKLFEIIDFMNSTKNIPSWEPYLRMATLLTALGHEIESNNTISREDIEKMDYRYLPFLTTIFDTPQKCEQLRLKLGLHIPVLGHLLEIYIEKDRCKNDAYLQYVETIDNERHGEEIQRYYETLEWSKFVQLLQLFMTHSQISGIDQELAFKVDQLFWRLMESSTLDPENAIQIYTVICSNHGKLDKYEGKIFLITTEILNNSSLTHYMHLPARALIHTVEATNSAQFIDPPTKLNIICSVHKYAGVCKNWDEGDKPELLQLLEKTEFPVSKQTIQALKV